MFKTTKAKVIFVTIFSIICFTITTLLIWYQNIDIAEKNEENMQLKVTDEKDVPGIDLKGTYNQNDLKVEEKSITKEKVEIRYLQISGLKNKEVENKINKEILQVALNCYKDEIKNLNEVINISVSMWEAANFANTISFELNYTAKIDDNDDGFYQGYQGLNFDLNTGEKITIEKLFTSDVPIENVLRRAVYYGLIKNRTEDNLAGDLIVSDYGDIEDEVAEIINLYKKGKIIQFSYTPICINLYYNEDEIITIDMKDFAAYIAIYNRYLSEESIFEQDNIGIKNIYTLSRRYNNIYYYTNYQNEDNYFIDISIDFQSVDSDTFAKKVIQEKIIGIEKEIEKIKQNVAENPNNFYVLNYHISVYTGEERSTKQVLTSCYERGNIYEMTVHDFEVNIEPIIIDYARQDESGGIPDYVYDFSNLLDLEPQNTVEYYNPQTQEKVVI